MKTRLHIVRPGEVGACLRVALRPCRCGHHRLVHWLLTDQCMSRGCTCPTWREAPPSLRLVR